MLLVNTVTPNQFLHKHPPGQSLLSKYQFVRFYITFEQHAPQERQLASLTGVTSDPSLLASLA
jgi:hypothetical protein